MKSIFSLMLTDLKLILKNIFFWVLLGTLVAIVLVVNFLLPKKVEAPTSEILTYGFEAAGYEQVENLQALHQKLESDSSKIGITLENGTYTVLSDRISPKQALAVLLPLLTPERAQTDIQFSSLSDETIQTPFNKRFLPVFISFEAITQGFLLAGVLMLNEKSEKTVRALQISPVRTIQYWTAKVLLFTFIGTVYALFMALFTIGIHFRILPFIAISAIASALFTMIGMITATFLRSINNWFMLASLILGINMLTLFAYIFPTLSLSFMPIIPSYPLIFIYEQILFGRFKLTSDAVTISIWFCGLCIISLFCVNNFFLRPQKGV